MTPLGIVMLVKLVQKAKALEPKLVKFCGNVTLTKLVQVSNADCPMLVTLLGIITLVRLELFLKALMPMPRTGTPPIVPGITTAPPGPV